MRDPNKKSIALSWFIAGLVVGSLLTFLLVVSIASHQIQKERQSCETNSNNLNQSDYQYCMAQGYF